MRSYSQVYNTSRTEVQEQRRKVVEAQKVAIVNVLKENYSISGKISDLDSKTKEKLAKKLAEYWSPKTGLNNAGVTFINEHRLVLTPKSPISDVKEYIRRMALKNIQEVTECFRHGQTSVIVESYNNEIHSMMGKMIKENFIIDTVWSVVADRIKKGV